MPVGQQLSPRLDEETVAQVVHSVTEASLHPIDHGDSQVGNSQPLDYSFCHFLYPNQWLCFALLVVGRSVRGVATWLANAAGGEF